MIPAGKLGQRVMIQAPDTVVDEYGQPDIVWVTKATVWAEIQGGGGGTGVVVSKGQVTYSHTVRVRMSSQLTGINETWRLMYMGRIFVISSISRADMLKAPILSLTCAEERV